MTSRFSVRLAIAEAFGLDFADIEYDYRYQPTVTPCAVYTIGDGYYTATKYLHTPPKGDKDYVWAAVPPPSGYMPDSWQLWINTVTID